MPMPMASSRRLCPSGPLLLLGFCLLLLLSAQARPQHRHRRHHQHHRRHLLPGQHFIVKNALMECKVPSSCRPQVESALLNQEQVPECDAVDYFDLLRCLDQWISRTNMTDLNSRAGQLCCEEIDEVSPHCQQACRSALFAPTLSHEEKQKRISMVCNRSHGDDVKGDNGLLTCLATTGEWLPERQKVMRR